MKFKVDENLPIELADLSDQAGHDAVTVNDEGLGGVDDDVLLPICKREERAFLTFDLGLSDMRT
jgi:predicted nuclease of predicted toxin-antitoxin system